MQHLLPQAPPQDYLTAGNLGVVEQQVDEISSAHLNGPLQLPSGPPINATSQFLGLALDPWYTSTSQSTRRDAEYVDYRQTECGSTLLSTMGPFGTDYVIKGLAHGYDQPNSRPAIPDRRYPEGLSQRFQFLFNQSDPTVAIPSYARSCPNMANNVDNHIFPPSSFDEPGLQLNSNWDDNVVGSAIGIDYHPANPGGNLMEHSNFSNISAQPAEFCGNSSAEIPDSWKGLSAVSPDTSLPQIPLLPPSEGSSSRARFTCYHPQCVGRSFSRRVDRDRHTRVHDGYRQYFCSMASCAKAFYRKDKLRSHVQNGH